MTTLDEALWNDVLSEVDPNEKRGILSWLAGLKMFSELRSDRINSWSETNNWEFTNSGSLRHEDSKFFEVVGVKASIQGREVSSWHQPLIKQHEHGIAALIISVQNGGLYCLVQAKSEAGSFDHLELAPTVQCILGSYKNPMSEIPYLARILNEEGCRIVSRTIQSEEGGRFYREQNINIVSYSEHLFEIESSYFRWVRVKDLRSLLEYNNLLNIELRSLFAIFMPI